MWQEMCANVSIIATFPYWIDFEINFFADFIAVNFTIQTQALLKVDNRQAFIFV